MAFFSRKFSSAQVNYSAYDRELTAIYEAVKYFRPLVEGRDFGIVTDHKPLIYAFLQKSDKASARQVRQLSFIVQFSTRIEHIAGADNLVADDLSRVDSLRLPVEVELVQRAEQQECDEQLKLIRGSKDYPLKMKAIQWGPAHTTVFCEITGETIRPYISVSLRELVFGLFHRPAHPSARITDRLIRQCYVWPKMHRDIAK